MEEDITHRRERIVQILGIGVALLLMSSFFLPRGASASWQFGWDEKTFVMLVQLFQFVLGLVVGASVFLPISRLLKGGALLAGGILLTVAHLLSVIDASHFKRALWLDVGVVIALISVAAAFAINSDSDREGSTRQSLGLIGGIGMVVLGVVPLGAVLLSGGGFPGRFASDFSVSTLFVDFFWDLGDGPDKVSFFFAVLAWAIALSLGPIAGALTAFHSAVSIASPKHAFPGTGTVAGAVFLLWLPATSFILFLIVWSNFEIVFTTFFVGITPIFGASFLLAAGVVYLGEGLDHERAKAATLHPAIAALIEGVERPADWAPTQAVRPPEGFGAPHEESPAAYSDTAAQPSVPGPSPEGEAAWGQDGAWSEDPSGWSAQPEDDGPTVDVGSMLNATGHDEIAPPSPRGPKSMIKAPQISRGQTLPPPPGHSDLPPPPSGSSELPPAPGRGGLVPPPSRSSDLPPAPSSAPDLPPPPSRSGDLPPPPSASGDLPPPPSSGMHLPPPPSSGALPPPPGLDDDDDDGGATAALDLAEVERVAAGGPIGGAVNSALAGGSSDDPEEHWRLGGEAWQAQDWHTALDHYLKVIKLQPWRTEALRAIADIHYGLGNLDQSENYYNRVLQDWPDDAHSTQALEQIRQYR